MVTDRKILGKLEQIEERYAEWRFEKVAGVPMEMWETREHLRREPGPKAKVDWRPAPLGTRWGGSWITAWFQGDAELPDGCDGRKVFIRAKTGGETLFTVDGEQRGIFDGNHPVVLMTMEGVAGRTYHLSLEAYAGHSFPGTQPHDKGIVVGEQSRTFDGVELLLEREDVSAFVFDLKVLRQVMNALDEHSLRRNRIIHELAKVYVVVDAIPDEVEEESWRPKLTEAREIMRPLLQAKNGSTVPWFGIIGHAHMDTAWLWPLSETWRKCARTFSSMLNLMEQYPEVLFIQSSSCQTDVIRREYPALFERIQQMVAAGRWEPNGGMWVEPDCNIPSGESLVRQLLVGQRTTREMFGYTADTLWLPDVFGYSAALPQILRGCGVEFFCTTKISWNDTTRFPHDTFIWKGIDGTAVITHYNSIHCWPDPEALTAQWNGVQHKDVQDRRLCAFGFGDGGGGPMAEMAEVARRVEDLEGCPRTRYTTVSDFMKGIRDELTDLPEWVGELYLELHRGTLTSISEVKRGNRKAEFALREAEFVCTLAALQGANYPKAELLEIWKKLLTNQFHDILPGSSIAEVNDEAIQTFQDGIAEAKEKTRSAVDVLAGPHRKGRSHLFIGNSLSWDRTGELVLDDVPGEMCPADPDVTAQWVVDVEGHRKLTVHGVAVPALGAAVLPLVEGEPSGASAFELGDDHMETPHAVVQFDQSGRIGSLVDKASGREIVQPGGALNTFLLGEDIPEAWDNWDIDRDQRLKMRMEDRLVRREVVANGPLQLRLRSEYKIGASSTLIQDMIFHSSTPRVDFETVLDWSDKHKLLKAVFDIQVLAEVARHEIQYGHVERPTHSNLPQDRARFEVCAHKWTDLSENGFGVALLNDGKYGISITGGTLGLSLIKSGLHPDSRGDEGRHVFTYSLLPHIGGFSVESVVRPAYERNLPPTVCLAGPEATSLGSLLTVDAPNVVVECVKWAEEGKGFVVRLYEAGKTGGHIKVTFNTPIRSVCETNLMEEDAQPLELGEDDHMVRFYMRPFEIKTLYVGVCGIGRKG